MPHHVEHFDPVKVTSDDDRMQIIERTRIILSSAPVARSFPSGLKHTLLMYKSFVLSAVSSTKTLDSNNN